MSEVTDLKPGDERYLSTLYFEGVHACRQMVGVLMEYTMPSREVELDHQELFYSLRFLADRLDEVAEKISDLDDKWIAWPEQVIKAKEADNE